MFGRNTPLASRTDRPNFSNLKMKIFFFFGDKSRKPKVTAANASPLNDKPQKKVKLMNHSSFQHVPVLMAQVLENLALPASNLAKWHQNTAQNLAPELLCLKIVDCTLGGAGHASEIIKHLIDRLDPNINIELLAFDQDIDAVLVATPKLQSLQTSQPRFKFEIINNNFSALKETVLQKWGPNSIDLLLADFGVSSWQLDEAARGFSFQTAGPIDMRMNKTNPLSAKEILLTYPFAELQRIFRQYGEEPRANKLAAAICKDRSEGKLPLENTVTFANFVERVLNYKGSRTHPATRVFQALRMEVNAELSSIEEILTSLPNLASESSHVGFITFHSLEDRITKRAMRMWEKGLNSNTKQDEERVQLPWEKVQSWGKEIPRGGLTAHEDEIRKNSRSRSARLRVFKFEKQNSA